MLAIQETGPTALGPALLAAIGMASQGGNGSTVVLCTDGLANVGLGQFDGISSEMLKEVENFYNKVGEVAKQKGVGVNLITVEGEDCNIATLSKVCEQTGGEVQMVNPANMKENFSALFRKETLATNVEVKFKLHKGLEFRNEDPASMRDNKTTLIKNLGNVTEDSEVTFEYRLKPIKELLAMEDIDLSLITKFPFQAQITYTTLDGARCVRVMTNQMDASDNKEEVNKQADFNILGVNAI